MLQDFRLDDEEFDPGSLDRMSQLVCRIRRVRACVDATKCDDTVHEDRIIDLANNRQHWAGVDVHRESTYIIEAVHAHHIASLQATLSKSRNELANGTASLPMIVKPARVDGIDVNGPLRVEPWMRSIKAPGKNVVGGDFDFIVALEGHLGALFV